MHKIFLLEKDWVVGLWWQPLVSSPRSQVKELGGEEPGEESPYNMFAVLKGRKQIGVGTAENPKENIGAFSLAGGLARAFDQHDNVLALFRFDDGNSWLFALKDGQILPGGDFYGSDDKVFEQYKRYSQSDIWQQIIETPDTQESENKIWQHLEDLFTPKSFRFYRKKLPKLWPVTRSIMVQKGLNVLHEHPKTVLVAAVSIMVVLVLVVGGQRYLAKQDELARQKKMEEKRAELEKKKKEGEDITPGHVRKKLFAEKWKAEPNPLRVIARCYSDLEKEPYQERGWKIDQVFCGPEKTRIIRQRSEWASFTLLPPDAQFQIQDPNQAVKEKEYDPEDRKPRKIIDKKEVSANIYELAKFLGSPVELNWERPDDRKVPEKYRKKNRELPEEISSPYWIGEFKLQDVPSSFIREAFGLDRIPGLVANEVAKDESWSIEGEVYAE